MPARLRAGFALVVALALSACQATAERDRPGQRPVMGLMSTLPLFWAEAADVGEALAGAGETGWVREELETRYAIEPLDTLDEGALAGIDRLVLAQPRPLSPRENVALDGWLRGGGRLLLFADPMLTHHSRFPVGDPRRPQDVALLSPILAHWGLELLFDDAPAQAERQVEIEGMAVPVNLAGRFRKAADAPCSLAASGILARCRIGKGRVLVLADAALLDDPAGDAAASRREALGQLLTLAFR